MFRLKIKSILMSFLLLAEIMYFAACGNKQPFSPTENSQPIVLTKKGSGGGNPDPNPSSTLLLVRKREENENGVSTAVIGPGGGVLTHAAHSLVVPPGALSQPVQLTFSMPVSDTLMFDLGPDGITFNAPVTLVLSYDHAFTSGVNEDSLKVVVWDPGTQNWSKIPTTVDTELNLASGVTDHFSRYAISKR